ncbi:hypothetical protein M422DRAFT_270156 [Sphaerobolus stellatus SS14]|uniref:DUF6532 domain-containing protein n=1 Tax=Sphaerobolus stellatus (strain SS14) TaxID=990650 RepID=A0A0C9UTQ4_SPHS4|nr:hypothetical protein M422DRAFT_270156 [Sphaerobolus stellatus SS14]
MARSGVLVVILMFLCVYDQCLDKFDPLPLPVVAYACTLIHCTLKSLLKGRRDTFTSDTYSPIFIEYLALLTELQEDSPDECQEVLKSLLAEGRKSLGETQEAICTNKRTPASGGLLQDAFDKELSMLRPILPSGPSVVTSGIVIGAALGPGASVSYAIVLYDSALSTLILQQIYPSPTVYSAL